MEIVEKLRDAASMFWQALDSEERRVLLVWTAYLVGSVLVSWQASRRQRERDLIVGDVLEALHRG